MATNQKIALKRHQRNHRRNKERKAWYKVFYILGHIVGVPGLLALLAGIYVGNPSAMFVGIWPFLIGILISAAAVEDEDLEIDEIEQKKLQDQPQAKKEESSQKPQLKLDPLKLDPLKLTPLKLDPVEEFIHKVSNIKEDQEGIEQYRSFLQSLQKECPKLLEMCSSKTNCSILHYEVMHGRVKFVQILLACGAVADLKSTGPIQGLIAFSGRNSQDLTKAVFSANVTPLMIAARYLLPEIVQTLISSSPKPNLNLKDNEGFTVLAHALFGVPLYGKDIASQKSARILIAEYLFQADAPLLNCIPNSEHAEDGHAFFLFVGSLAQTFLIPSFLKYTSITLESRNLKNDTIFMYCIKHCRFTTLKELIELKVNVDTINEIDPKVILVFLSECISKNEKELAKFIISKIRIKQTLIELFRFANIFDANVKSLLQSTVTRDLLSDGTTPKKKTANVAKTSQRKFKPIKQKRYTQERKVLSEADKLSNMVAEKSTFYPSKIDNSRTILMRDKKIILELQSALIENQKINQRICVLPNEEECRVDRLKINLAESQNVEQLLTTISDTEYKLHIFQKRLESLNSEIQLAKSAEKEIAQESLTLTECGAPDMDNAKKDKMDKCKLKRMNLENKFIQLVLPLWENTNDGIETLLELIKKKKFALSSVQDWQNNNRIDAKYKRGDIAAPEQNVQNTAHQNTPHLTTDPLEIIQSHRAQKRDKHIAKQAKRTERLKRFDHAVRKQKEEQVIYFASSAKAPTPPRKSPVLQAQSLPTAEPGFRTHAPQPMTFGKATWVYERAITLEEVDPISKALQFNCPKNCEEAHYKKYDSYDILLVCAQAMHSLNQNNQAIFPKNMAKQFRNAIYKGKLFNDEDFIKRNAEIRIMAEKLKDFISERCKKLSDTDLKQSDIEVAIKVPIFSEIFQYKVPPLHLKDSGKYQDLCIEVMDKCKSELEDKLQLQSSFTPEKWTSACYLIKARLGAHFNYFKRNCKSHPKYHYYLEIFEKYRKFANQIRHNEKRPVLKAQTVKYKPVSETQDLANDLILSLSSSASSKKDVSITMNNVLALTESLGINHVDLEAVAKRLSDQADFSDYQAAFPPTLFTMRRSSVSTTDTSDASTEYSTDASTDTPTDSSTDTSTDTATDSSVDTPLPARVLFTQGMRRSYEKGQVRV